MKNIDLNTIEGLSSLKDELNTVIDLRINEAKKECAVNNVKNHTLGELKYLFENICDKLYDIEEGKKVIKSYINTIKENKELSNFYKIFDLIKNASDVDNANIFLNEALSLSKKPTDESRQKLSIIIENGIKALNMTTDDVDSILSTYGGIEKSLSYVLSESKTNKNVIEYSNNLSNICESIKDNKKSVCENATIEDINNVLSECTEKWEQNVINDISLYTMAGKRRDELFEDYKNDCINIITENLDNADSVEEKNNFSVMLEGLSNKVFNDETFIDDIIKLSELKETLKS